MADEKLTIQHLQKQALDLWKKDQTSARDLGAALIKVRDEMLAAGHGKFTDWVRRQALDTNRVNYCMQVVEGKRTKGKGKELKPDALKKVLAAMLKKGEQADLNVLAKSEGKTITEAAVEILQVWLFEHPEKVQAAQTKLAERAERMKEENRRTIAASEVKLLKLKLEKQEAYLAGKAPFAEGAMLVPPNKKKKKRMSKTPSPLFSSAAAGSTATT